MARRLLGKEVTAALNEKIKENVAALKAKGISPTLGIVRVEREDDLSSERGATKRCETLGVACEKYLLPAENVTQEKLLEVIHQVNQDDKIHGVLIFRPLPKHLDEAAVIQALAGEGRRWHYRRLHGGRVRRDQAGISAMHTTGVHGDTGSLWH